MRKGIRVCGSTASIDEKTRDDDNASDRTLAGIGRLLAGCGVAMGKDKDSTVCVAPTIERAVLSDVERIISDTAPGTSIELVGSGIGMRIDSIAPMVLGTMKENSTIEEERFEGKLSVSEPIPDPSISVGIGVLVGIAVTMLLVSSGEV